MVQNKDETQKQQATGVTINSQYVKDLSFESPRVPGIFFEKKESPKVDISIDVAVKKLQESVFEVTLAFDISSSINEEKIFVVDLKYSGIFTIRGNVAEEELKMLLLIYCPNLLFPFARRIIADVTSDGGFPQLMIDPVDFASLYKQSQEKLSQEETNKKADVIN